MKMKLKEIKKKKNYIFFAAAVILIFIVICNIAVHIWKENVILQNKLEELQKEQISTDAIREELKEISKYSAYEFDYTSILYYSDPNKIKNMDIPFTTTTYIATIEGTMNIGIEGDYVDFLTEKNEEGNITKIIVKLPQSQILDNYTDSSTLKEYEYKKGVFNPIEPSEVTALRTNAENTEAAKVNNSDILQKSDERIEHLLKSNINAFLGEDVEVELEYIDVPSDAGKEEETEKP